MHFLRTFILLKGKKAKEKIKLKYFYMHIYLLYYLNERKAIPADDNGQKKNSICFSKILIGEKLIKVLSVFSFLSLRFLKPVRLTVKSV